MMSSEFNALQSMIDEFRKCGVNLKDAVINEDEIVRKLKNIIPKKLHERWQEHFNRYGILPEKEIEKYIRRFLRKVKQSNE